MTEATMPDGTTHVVILAAGKGQRLGPLTEETPKWLLDVGGRTIAERQLEAIRRATDRLSGSLAPVRVVSGHAADTLERWLEQRDGHQLDVLHNVDYARLNNWYSVLLALRSFPAESNDRFVLFNGDLFAHPEWMAQFVIDAAAAEEESLIAVDLERNLTDESMKVAVDQSREGAAATLRLIGKVGVDHPVGEYVGMLMARGSVLHRFREMLESFV